ncbi:hypothetical protein CVT26_009951 [Gymnopilus dilepis]|uniref:Uncharacterized protein n=1 Tax=Gymnopilus dilepis TaxID=231916 RepID=A0A409VL52_9AGAR|nr:hypothetical protein CVT26_009951 [Gymnopilus dilepis]
MALRHKVVGSADDMLHELRTKCNGHFRIIVIDEHENQSLTMNRPPLFLSTPSTSPAQVAVRHDGPEIRVKFLVDEPSLIIRRPPFEVNNPRSRSRSRSLSPSFLYHRPSQLVLVNSDEFEADPCRSSRSASSSVRPSLTGKGTTKADERRGTTNNSASTSAVRSASDTARPSPRGRPSASSPTTPVVTRTYWPRQERDPADMLREILSSPSRTSLLTVRAVRRVREHVEEIPTQAIGSLPRASKSVGHLTLNSKPASILKSLRRRLSSILRSPRKEKTSTTATSSDDEDEIEPRSPTGSLGIEYLAPRRVRSFTTPEEVRTSEGPMCVSRRFDEATREASFVANRVSSKYQYLPQDEDDD